MIQLFFDDTLKIGTALSDQHSGDIDHFCAGVPRPTTIPVCLDNHLVGMQRFDGLTQPFMAVSNPEIGIGNVFAVGEIFEHHALGIIAQIIQAQRVIGFDHDQQPFLAGLGLGEPA